MAEMGGKKKRKITTNMNMKLVPGASRCARSVLSLVTHSLVLCAGDNTRNNAVLHLH